MIIADAGGGTIDISDFACNADIPTSFNEISPPQCEFSDLFSSTSFCLRVQGHFHGSVFVSINARNFLEGGSAFQPSDLGISSSL